MTDFLPNTNISAADLAFPAKVAHLIPPHENLMDTVVSKEAATLTTDWFYHGLKKIEPKPKDGVDVNAALAHIKCILASFQPKHEVKMQAVAYLIDLWFDEVAWEPGNANR